MIAPIRFVSTSSRRDLSWPKFSSRTLLMLIKRPSISLETFAPQDWTISGITLLMASLISYLFLLLWPIKFFWSLTNASKIVRVFSLYSSSSVLRIWLSLKIFSRISYSWLIGSDELLSTTSGARTPSFSNAKSWSIRVLCFSKNPLYSLS